MKYGFLDDIICHFKGHFPFRENNEVLNPFCLRCGKIFDHEELVNEYKKFMKKEYRMSKKRCQMKRYKSTTIKS